MLSKMALSLAAVALGVTLAACGASTQRPHVAPEDVVLRLTDLPRGYRIGDDSGCGEVEPEGATDQLRELIIAESPRGCAVQLEQAYGRSGTPRLVESWAVVFATQHGAKRGFELAPGLFGGTIEGKPRKSPVALGDETRALETRDALVAGKLGNPGLALVWRQGIVVNLVYVAGLAGRAAEQRATALARIQQARAVSPSPAPAAATDDREVSLDDPALDIDVWWLGRSFSPGHGVPRLALYDSHAPIGAGGGPGFRADIEYSGGIRLGLWEARAWKRFRTGAAEGGLGALGRLVTASPCVHRRRLVVRGKHVVVYATRPRPNGALSSSCPQGPPTAYYAAVDLGPTVVTINLPICFYCFGSHAGAYDSESAIRAVVAGLRRR